jgi:ABC-type nitrate/sulfonate/bicarbonate transport system substrate-binding protein
MSKFFLELAVAMTAAAAVLPVGACADDDGDHDAEDPPPCGRPDDPPPRAAVRLGFFSTNLPLEAAFARGFFEDENLDVTTQQVTTSIDLFQSVAEGTIDIALTSADNPVNYRLNADNPVNNGDATLDVQMIFGDHRGLGLALVAQPELTTIESLRGKTCGVDAPVSGFAYVLYEMLQQHGLAREADYTVVQAGGTPIRLRALRDGMIDCTLLNADSIVRAREEGFAVLATIDDIASPYLGGVGAARESWLRAHSDIAIRFIRAYARAELWIENKDNRKAVIELLTDAETSAALAGTIYEAAVHDPTGLIHQAEFDAEGLLSVLELRQTFNGFESAQDLPYLASPDSGLYDLQYLERATRDLDRCDSETREERVARPPDA